MSTADRRSNSSPRWARAQRLALPVVTPMFAAAVGLLVGALLLMAVGANPFTAYMSLLDGAVGSKNSIADTLVRATPLLFVAVGICIAFRAGVMNIGGEGQFIVGAICATMVALHLGALPGPVLIVVASVAGGLGGAAWGGIAGWLKAQLAVNEILSTVMLNVIAGLLMNFLVAGPWMDPRQIEQGTRLPETARFPRHADLPRLLEPTRLHLGFVVAIVSAVVAWIVLWKTPFGFRIRAVGFNPAASRYAGMSVRRNAMMALTLSGMLCGLGGAIQVLGLDHRLYSEGNAAAFTGLAGFNGIVVALFGGLHPLGAIPASVLFGGLVVGANSLQRTEQVPSSIAVTLNGIVVLVVVSCQWWQIRRQRRLTLPDAFVEEFSTGDGDSPPPDDEPRDDEPPDGHERTDPLVTVEGFTMPEGRDVD